MLHIEGVTLQERVEILEAFMLKKMLQDGVTLKGTSLHEAMDSAKKSNLNPEKALIVYEALVNEFVSKVFTGKRGH